MNDDAHQLTSVAASRPSDAARYRYDALGRRVEAIRSDGTVDRYVYFPGTFLVLAVLDGSNNPKEFYTRGPDLSGTLSGAGGIGGILACTYASGPVLYHHADLMGSVIALTDSSSILTTIFRYTPFGNIIDGTSHKYMHQGIGWLQRKSVQLIVNGMATIIDDFVDDMNHFDFRRKIDSKVKSFEKIKMDALEWLRWAEDNYECCVNGQIVPLTVFPGVLAGDKDLPFGVAHCAFGVLARQRGISFVELLVANVAWEGKEFVDSEYWEWMPPWMPHMKVGNIEITPKKGLDGWMRDTLSDILLVEVGYVAGDSLEYCIPKQCYRKHMEQ